MGRFKGVGVARGRGWGNAGTGGAAEGWGWGGRHGASGMRACCATARNRVGPANVCSRVRVTSP